MDELDAFLDRLTARLSSVSGTLTAQTLRRIVSEAQGWHAPNDPKLEGQGRGIPCGGMTVNYVGSGAGHTVEPNTVYDSSAEHWSPWLPGDVHPCPLPPSALVQVEGCEAPASAHGWNWPMRFKHFRYRSPDPAGWLPRGEFVPPAELWAEGCPVRCEWRNDRHGLYGGTNCEDWTGITHIRLVARQPQAGLPEGWEIHAGSLIAPCGRVALAGHELDRHGPAAIRQAVDAWLRETGDE